MHRPHTRATLSAHAIGYTFADSGITLFSDLSLSLEQRTQALVGRNGVGKSVLARLLAGKLTPSTGRIEQASRVGYLPQQLPTVAGTVAVVLGWATRLEAYQRVLDGMGSGDDFALLDTHWELPHHAAQALESVGLSKAQLWQPVATLSGGERTRLALLGLKEQGAQFLILDEPGNHLDRKGRQWLAGWLESFHGGALVITHDRELLRHSDLIYELDSHGLHKSQGGLEAYLVTRQARLVSAQNALQTAEKTLAKAKRTGQRSLEQRQHRAAEGRQQRKEANQSKLLLDAKQGRCEKTTARTVQAHGRRLEEATRQYAEAAREVERLQPLVFVPAPTTPAYGVAVRLDRVMAPFGISSPLSVVVQAGERLAIVGRNGSGKSTLLHLLNGDLQPLNGTVAVPTSRALLDQHCNLLDERASALENFMRLAPGWDEASYRTRLAQLRLRADHALLPVQHLSGGERLKLALTCLFCGPTAPSLLLLDEPDNHLDLESRELLERVLATYDGTMVVVSHDEEFLTAIGCTHRLSLDHTDNK